MLVEHLFDAGIFSVNYGESTFETGSELKISGCPLVLLHGGSARWQAFRPIIPALSQRYHLYMPDLRGHGKSARMPGGYNIAGYAHDVALFLAQVVKAPSVLYGHSLGGQVAIMVAARYPHLVRGLIIGDAPFDRDKLRATLRHARERLLLWRHLASSGGTLEEIAEALKNMPVEANGGLAPVPARTVFGEDSVWFPYMAENLSLLDPAMLTAVLEFDDMHAEYDCDLLFPNITCPVLIVQGNPALGGGLSDEEVTKAMTLLPHAALARLETVGHALDYPDKEPLLRAISSFMDSPAISAEMIAS